MTALLLPPTDRLLRGAQSALADLDTQGRPDIAHVVAMVQMVLGHVHHRLGLDTLRDLHSDIMTGVARASDRLGLPSPTAGTFPSGDFDAAQAVLGQAYGTLRDLVSAAGAARLPSDDPLWAESVTLERRFYDATVPNVAAPAGPAPLTRDGFEQYLLDRFSDRYRAVRAFRKLVGGFQKETILVDLERVSGVIDELVIRAEKHDRFVNFTASAITDEFAVVRMLWDKGVPVAEPIWLEADEGLLGRRFMVSRRAAGANTGSAYGDSGVFPDALVASFMDSLARIHAVDLDRAVAATALGRWMGDRTLAENTRVEIAAWRHQIWLDRAPPSPTFTRLFDWLEANVPEESGRACLLHNDYGPHNIMVEGTAVSAVLDWEVPRIGDPAEDLSFFLQCAGAAVDRKAALAAYETLSGNRVSPYRLAYFDVLSIAKVLVSTLSATTMYQATEPALIDWMQMPLLMHGAYQRLAEERIAAAEALRGL